MSATCSPLSSVVAKSAVVRVLVGVLVFSSMPVVLYGMQHAEKVPASEFLRQYRQAVEVLQSTYRNVQIEGRSTVDNSSEYSTPPPTKPKGGHRAEKFGYVFCDGSEKIFYLRDKPEYFDRVLVNAGGHQFSVRRTSAGGSYFLEYSERSTEARHVFGALRTEVRDALYCPFRMTGFLDVLSSPECRIREVARTSEGSSSIAKVFFECPRGGKRKYDIAGWIALDTSMNWVIRNYEFEVRQDNAPKVARSIGSVRSKREGDLVIPLVVENKQVSKYEKLGLTRTLTHRHEISKFLPISTPPDEFTLAAYGLGEFETPSRRPTNLFPYYAIAIGAAALLASLMLSRIGKSLQRRRSTAPDASTPG